MTVLMVAPTEGGVAHVAARVAEEWRRRGVSVNLTAVSPSGTVECGSRSVRRSRSERGTAGAVALRALTQVWWHRRCCVDQAERVHVELGRTSGSAFWFALGVAAMRRPLPMVVALHDLPMIVKHPAALLLPRHRRVISAIAYRVLAPLLDRPLVSFLRRSCAATVVLTEQARRVADAAGWPRVARVVHGADDAPALPVDPADATTVVLAGYLGAGKGLDVLADAWAQVADCAPELTLTIVGTAATEGDQAWVDAVSARLDTGARPPRWLGHVSDADFARTIEHCAVLVLPYEQSNPASGPLVRALVAGRAIVATRVSAVLDEIVDGQDGLLCQPGDADGLATCLRRVMGDPALRTKLGQAAARRGQAHTWRAHVDVIERVHQILTEDSGITTDAAVA